VTAFCLSICLFTSIKAFAQDYPGLPTRSQNPFLQSYFIPTIPISTQQKLSISHALYITNTYQIENTGNENLVIDVENIRYDFQLGFSHSLWHFNLTLPLLSNGSGFLDQTIEGWHDFWGLPQGGRDSARNDQINLLYQKNGIDIINTQTASQGVGDIQLAVGYQLSSNGQFWFALEIPSSDNDLFISNQEVDVAFWYLTSAQLNNKLATYGSLGLSFPNNDGLFAGRMEKRVMFGQMGLKYAWYPRYQLLLQLDLHSRIAKDSALEALGHSLQAQFGLRMTPLFNQHQLDVFFSEDILPGYAPDITFGIRLSPMSF
jgi:hypothetical protein